MSPALFKCCGPGGQVSRRGLPPLSKDGRRNGTLSSGDSDEDIEDAVMRLSLATIHGGSNCDNAADVLVKLGVLEVKSVTWPQDTRMLLHHRSGCVFTRHFRIRPEPDHTTFIMRLNCEVNIMCDLAKDYLLNYWRALGHLVHPETVEIERLYQERRLVRDVLFHGSSSAILSEFIPSNGPSEPLGSDSREAHHFGSQETTRERTTHRLQTANSLPRMRRPVLAKPTILLRINVENDRYIIRREPEQGEAIESTAHGDSSLWQIVEVNSEIKPPTKGLMSDTMGRARASLAKPIQAARRQLPGSTSPHAPVYLEKDDILRFGSFRLTVTDIVFDSCGRCSSKPSGVLGDTIGVTPSDQVDPSGEISPSSSSDTSSQTSYEAAPVCRICFDEGSREDKLLRPCDCRGSVKHIHRSCLEKWVEGQMRTRRLDNGGGTYLLRPLKCELCRVFYRNESYSSDLLPRPACPHVVLEEVQPSHNHHVRDQHSEARRIHIVAFPKPSYVGTIGRSKDCDVLLTDISVSRTHAAMKLTRNRILLVDRGSKFGTLRKIGDRVEVPPNCTFVLQHGSSMFSFTASKALKYRLFPLRYLSPALPPKEREVARLKAYAEGLKDAGIADKIDNMDDDKIIAELKRVFPETGVRMYRSCLPRLAMIEEAWQHSRTLNIPAHEGDNPRPTIASDGDIRRESDREDEISPRPLDLSMLGAIQRSIVTPLARRLTFSEVLPVESQPSRDRAFSVPRPSGLRPSPRTPRRASIFLPLQILGIERQMIDEAETARAGDHAPAARNMDRILTELTSNASRSSVFPTGISEDSGDINESSSPAN
ncbi:hypothetical protein FOL47_011368 [Perkinsus chesapeaki]|uniref:E3 ubiquitin-protein ligase march6 n=1 Tax=Perkinsus chesapeaki TaxID=330153 RepID=A0A7J6MMG8_PERCH|nr:hypothetical protein FOL47_011368 [Perkinsus chesapeaki]